jgi:extradiol dioxygenase family protein
MNTVFHIAYNVTSLEVARDFYGNLLGCKEGRSSETWVDYDFFGHQISLHLGTPFETKNTGQVGDKLVPMPHIGLVMELQDWSAAAKKLTDAKTDFVLPPQIRFAGEPGEQWTMFFLDPFGNPIEFKGFRSLTTIYNN